MTDALIERLEAAREGSRELDGLIAQAAGAAHGPFQKVYYESRSVEYIEECAKPYTTSLDAATTLRPEGWDYGCGSQECTVKAWAWVGKREAPNSIQWATMFSENAATPALALCIAALRAQAGEKA